MNNNFRKRWPLTILAGAVLAVVASQSHAQRTPPATNNPGARIERLQQQISEQARQIETLRQAVAEQDARQSELQRALSQEPRPVAGPVAPAPAIPAAPDESQRSVRVGAAPGQENQPPAVAPLFDQPGILTPRGKFALEPSVQYS